MLVTLLLSLPTAVLGDETQSVDTLYENAKTAAELGDLDTALLTAEEIITIDPEYTNGWLIISTILDSAGKYEEAALTLDNAITYIPDNLTLIVTLAYMKNRAGHYDEALDVMNDALVLSPASPDIRNAHAYTRYLCGDIDGAESEVRGVLVEDPGYGAALDTLGAILIEKGEYSEALLTLQKAVKSVPVDEEVAGHYGDAYFGLNNLNKAKEWYQKGVNADITYLPTVKGYAKTLTALKRYNEADAAYTAALRLSPGDPELIIGEQEGLDILYDRFVKSKTE